MNINTIWGVLMQGVQHDPQEISRKVARAVFDENTQYLATLNVLVPYKDQILRSFQVEQLVRLLLASTLRGRALALDPINTYEKSTLMFPEPGSLNTALPGTSRLVHMTSPSAFEDYGNGQVVFSCAVNPAAGTFTSVDGVQSFTVSNNLSSIITVTGGFQIRFQGALGGAPFTFDLAYTADPTMRWMRLLANIKAMEHIWLDEDLRNIYVEDVYWQNQIAAVIMNSVENAIQ